MPVLPKIPAAFVLLTLLVAAPPGATAADPAPDPADEEASQGFVPIFNGRDLTGWVGLNDDTGSYYVRDGLLICKDTGQVHIFTEKEYANFILRLQIKLDPGGNNGIGVRTQISPQPHIDGLEIQVLDDEYYADGDPIQLKDYQHHGSIYGVVPAKTGHLKPAGQWNDEEIVCDGRHLKVTLNGTVIVDANLDEVKPIDDHEHPGLQVRTGPHQPARPRQLRRRGLLPQPAGQAARVAAWTAGRRQHQPESQAAGTRAFVNPPLDTAHSATWTDSQVTDEKRRKTGVRRPVENLALC